MNETIAVRRTGSQGWRTAMWVAGTAVGSQMLAGLVFGIFIGVAEVAAVVFSFTEEVGVPVFRVLLAGGSVAYAAAVHLAVRVTGRSAEVPWVIWPAMAALPTTWIFIALAEPSDALQPWLAVLTMAGITLAFVTLGNRRWASA